MIILQLSWDFFQADSSKVSWHGCWCCLSVTIGSISKCTQKVTWFFYLEILWLIAAIYCIRLGLRQISYTLCFDKKSVLVNEFLHFAIFSFLQARIAKKAKKGLQRVLVLKRNKNWQRVFRFLNLFGSFQSRQVLTCVNELKKFYLPLEKKFL